MKFYEKDVDGFVEEIGCGTICGEEITEERYTAIRDSYVAIPMDNKNYRLTTDLRWVEYPVQEDDPTAEEVLNIILGEE